MLDRLLLVAGLTVAAAPALRAQTPAEAQFFTRVENGVVRAAVEVELEGAWHIYHEVLGHPKAVGQPTKIELSGTGIHWSAPRFPEPIKIDQSDVAGPGTFILAHEHRLVVYAAGRLEPGATGADAGAKIKALVCEDVQGCIPFRKTLTSAGTGPDALFAAFPADLVPPAAAASAESAEPAPPPPGASASSTTSAAPVTPAQAHAEAKLYTRVEGRVVRAALDVELEGAWHIYHEVLGHPKAVGQPTKIELAGTGIAWSAPRFPEPIKIDQSDVAEPGTFILAHEHRLVVYAAGRLEEGATGADAGASIKALVCEDVQGCVPFRKTLASAGTGPDALFAAFPADLVPPAAEATSASAEPAKAPPSASTSSIPDPAPTAPVASSSESPAPAITAKAPPPAETGGEDGGLWLFLLAAIGGGLFALVMPCTYPMIPITISFFTKQAEKRGGTPLALSLAYGAGIVLIFVVVGVVFGSLIRPFAAHPITNLVLAVAFVYFALVLFGAVNLEPPRALMNVAGAASSQGGYLGVFLMGAALVVTSFTCTAPFVGSLLSIGASGGSTTRVGLGMTVFGLTMAIPFVLLSLIPGRVKAMPRSGEWMNTVKVTLGFVELAAALKFLSNTDLVWQWHWLSRDLFLVLWSGIFAVAALFLFGLLRMKSPQAEISPGRMVAGLGFVLFALYCWNGAAGSALDPVMTAIIPNYSTRPAGGGAMEGRKHAVVIDDYETARRRAIDENKKLLVNFTGYT